MLGLWALQCPTSHEKHVCWGRWGSENHSGTGLAYRSAGFHGKSSIPCLASMAKAVSVSNYPAHGEMGSTLLGKSMNWNEMKIGSHGFQSPWKISGDVPANSPILFINPWGKRFRLTERLNARWQHVSHWIEHRPAQLHDDFRNSTWLGDTPRILELKVFDGKIIEL